MTRPLDHTALRIRVPAERWQACRGTVLENACLRSIADEQAEPGTWLHDAATYAYDAARSSGEDRALFIADMEEAFAAELAEEQAAERFSDRCYRFECRTGKPWDSSPDLRAQAPVRSVWGMAHG